MNPIVIGEGSLIRSVRRLWVPLVFGPLMICGLAAFHPKAASARLPGESPTGSTSSKIYATGPPYLFRHNIGLLDLMATNVACVGNPNFIDGYGARWRDNEYLYVAGLWIGAIASDNLPYVSTGAYEYELRPSLDPVDTIYPSYEGIPHGNRIGFSSQPDDDGDGLIDEDFQNGKDDDGDGMIDEDYGAISDQMFSCEYWDYTSEARQQYPEHRPLNVKIQERSFAWSLDGINEFAGYEYHVVNDGFELLRDFYLGLLVDSDIGPRDHAGYFADDGGAYVSLDTTLVDPTISPCDTLHTHLEMAYMYDIPDGHGGAQGGDAEGFFGVLLLSHSTDPTGRRAPPQVRIGGCRHFNGSSAYPMGDPANDAQRYDLLSAGAIEQHPTGPPDDYRFVISTQRFPELAPGESIDFTIAFVAGEGYFDTNTWEPNPRLGPDGRPSSHSLMANAMRARLLFEGRWKNLDDLAETGVAGRETCVYTAPGDPYPWTDPCDSLSTVLFNGSSCEDPNSWVDNDCNPCTPNPADEGCAGGGCETLVHWYAQPAVVGVPEDPQDPASAGDILRLVASPNPVRVPARIRLESGRPAVLSLQVLDAGGRLVRALGQYAFPSGTSVMEWDGRDSQGKPVGSGIFFVRVTDSSGRSNPAVARLVTLGTE